MLIRSFRLLSVSVAACIFTAAPLLADTTLLFQPASGAFGNFAGLPAGYGNRVTAASQNGFLYGVTGGGTPNVTTNFATSPQNDYVFTWDTAYGDLLNVVSAFPNGGLFEFDLIADPGFQVKLNSFDMAGWPFADMTINSVSVLDGSNSVLFNQNNALILGASGIQHTHFAFNNLTGSELKIRFDSLNVDSDDVGLDNINFSQTATVGASVPELSSVWLLATLMASLIATRLIRNRWRSQKQSEL